MSVYQIEHVINYAYDRPVTFAPHQLRLYPRSNIHQSVLSCELSLSPTPQKLVATVDLDGNNALVAWFDDNPATHLQIRAHSTVASHLTDPFDYFLEPWATQLPIDYPVSLSEQLQPYLAGYLARSLDPIAAALAGEIWHTVNGNLLDFLTKLNQQIYHNCNYTLRDTGAALPPGIVWQNRAGSCRDFAVLFIEVCRAVGLAGRFVSGYEVGADTDERHLHAWAEIYLPGAGWRGYDPTHGLVVAQHHIAITAAPFPAQTTPVAGKLRTLGAISTTMSYQLTIQKT
ncbi:transglutaminase family protein [Chamaesiphon minutus]|uniref:Transglutaminase-like enzyme, predicted cysteine protease n=1 Tax=Chamaesiphon minutus (strain ATCC 27169 / PCC 6605) TaxID=1173020 RepID=K9UMF2_CHAP6|nr:transglutaminase family protein [Chamaesiphon minutus]AFY96010.1 transglutaminase-like enzyme, predicted cysteine protease [Chamaesiphon minutus PCC 6605]